MLHHVNTLTKQMVMTFILEKYSMNFCLHETNVTLINELLSYLYQNVTTLYYKS